MNVFVTEFLTEKNKDGAFQDDNVNLLAPQVIIALGGFNKVINLCLTHDDSMADDEYCHNALSSLRELMTKVNINDNNLKKAKNAATTISIDNSVESVNIKQNSNNLEQIAQDSPFAAISTSSQMHQIQRHFSDSQDGDSSRNVFDRFFVKTTCNIYNHDFWIHLSKIWFCVVFLPSQEISRKFYVH